MTIIALKQFNGEVPNVPSYALPEASAQQAKFCDFAQKDLRPLKNGLLYKTMSAPVKGIYTEDGILFYTWPIETAAFKSQVIGDTYGRVYFMNANGFKVAQYSGATVNGGEPAASWLVGVPVPTVAPTLAVIERTTLRDYPDVTLTLTAWYELNGERYDEDAAVSIVMQEFLRRYTLDVPPRGEGDLAALPEPIVPTPLEAKLTVGITLHDNIGSANIVETKVALGDTVRSNAVPGGVEIKLEPIAEDNLSVLLTIKWGVYETRAYAYRARNTFAETGGISPVATIDVSWMQDVKIGITPPVMTGYRPLQDIQFFRTVGTVATLINIQVTPNGVNTYDDFSYKAADFGAALDSFDFEPPPTGLFGLMPMSNGIFAAFKDNVLYFSEPYRPHSWQYSMSFPLNIRGICMAPQAMVVTTAGGAYLVQGAHPSQMSQMLLPVPQAGVSHRSMVMIDGAVAYASNDGIVIVAGSQASMDVSQGYWSREDWRNLYGDVLTDMRFAYHDGFLVATSSTQPKGFIVRLDEARGTLTQHNDQYDASFYLPVLDTLYYSVGANVYRFRTGPVYQMDWWSKDFILPSHTSFGAAYLRCSGTAMVSIYTDGVLWYQITGGTGYYRLPAGKRALKYSIRIQGVDVVEEFVMAQMMMELRAT